MRNTIIIEVLHPSGPIALFALDIVLRRPIYQTIRSDQQIRETACTSAYTSREHLEVAPLHSLHHTYAVVCRCGTPSSLRFCILQVRLLSLLLTSQHDKGMQHWMCLQVLRPLAPSKADRDAPLPAALRNWEDAVALLQDDSRFGRLPEDYR